MPVPIALLALLVAAPIALPPTSNAIGAVPDEPGAFVLPDPPILQTVAADLDGDGSRELVRLVRGDGDAALSDVRLVGTLAVEGEPRLAVHRPGSYRELPWVPIVAAIVVVAALILIVRVPRPTPQPRRADDDSALEELEPD